MSMVGLSILGVCVWVVYITPLLNKQHPRIGAGGVVYYQAQLTDTCSSATIFRFTKRVDKDLSTPLMLGQHSTTTGTVSSNDALGTAFNSGGASNAGGARAEAKVVRAKPGNEEDKEEGKDEGTSSGEEEEIPYSAEMAAAMAAVAAAPSVEYFTVNGDGSFSIDKDKVEAAAKKATCKLDALKEAFQVKANAEAEAKGGTEGAKVGKARLKDIILSMVGHQAKKGGVCAPFPKWPRLCDIIGPMGAKPDAPIEFGDAIKLIVNLMTDEEKYTVYEIADRAYALIVLDTLQPWGWGFIKELLVEDGRRTEEDNIADLKRNIDDMLLQNAVDKRQNADVCPFTGSDLIACTNGRTIGELLAVYRYPLGMRRLKTLKYVSSYTYQTFLVLTP